MRQTASSYIPRTQLQQPARFPASRAAVHPHQALVLSLCSSPVVQLPAAKFYSHEVTPCIYISTLADLQHLAKELREEEEIGVYVENHTQHSYFGYICLIMISTPWKDYVVDTLLLRPYVASMLGPIFASPRPLKVFHDAASQLKCLQRDFGIFLVNLVDTKEAAIIMGCVSTSYYYLLSVLCGVQYNNPYQQADWRMRPLQSYMLLYASSNTHSLLYLWDTLRIRLAQMQVGHTITAGPGTELYGKIMQVSNNLCLTQVYVVPSPEDLYKDFISGPNAGLVPKDKQWTVSRLFKLRDDIARKEDENPTRLIPDPMLLKIASLQPKTAEQLAEVCEKAAAGYVPEAVKKHSKEILDSLQEPAVAPSVAAVADNNPAKSGPLPPPIFATLKWVKSASEAGPDKETETEYQRILQMDKLDIKTVIPEVYQDCPKVVPAMLLLADILNRSKTDGGTLSAESNKEFTEKINTMKTENEGLEGADDAGRVKEVPSTFEQIYDISNRNKRRNKMLKKDKKKASGEEAAGGSSESVLKIVQAAIPSTASLGNKNMLNTAQFLRAIGWMGKGQQTDSAVPVGRGKKSFTPNTKPFGGFQQQYIRKNCYAF